MSINVKNFQIHQLLKNELDELIVELGKHNLPLGSTCDVLVSEIHSTFRNKVRSFGTFRDESEFMHAFNAYHHGHFPFYELTRRYAEYLVSELSKYPFADVGALAFAEYQYLATDYFMVCLIPSKNGITLEPGEQKVSLTDYLDIPQITIAAQLNLSSYFDKNQDSYYNLSFIKGRTGRRVSDFFLDFLSAEIAFDTKQQNSALIQAVSDFIGEYNLDKDEATQFKKHVADYCKDKKCSGENIILCELSSEVPTSPSGLSFAQYINEQGYELEKEFPTDQSIIKKLTKYVGAGGGLNISFDRVIFGERVFYDPETDTLTIKGTPPNLRDQLTRG